MRHAGEGGSQSCSQLRAVQFPERLIHYNHELIKCEYLVEMSEAFHSTLQYPFPLQLPRASLMLVCGDSKMALVQTWLVN
jgi:hypothetical protein